MSNNASNKSEKNSADSSGKFTSKLEKQAVSLLLAKDELEKKNIELERAIEDARKANMAKDLFLSNMSHEIRTPINTMMGMNELILRESQDETIRGYALDIKQAGEILVSLISDILDFSKIQSGRMELVEATYDISSLLNDIINSISIPLRKKKLRLSLDIADDVPYKLSGDEIHLRQVVGNLLSNAVKYTNTGMVTLHLSWKKIDEDNISLEIAVEDTGIGVKKKDMKKIFETFTRLDMEASSAATGTGLGLAVSHRLVELMGGKLEVESEFGKGSTFSFAIPQKVISKDPLGDFQKQYDRSVRTSIGYREKFIAPLGKVLVVDDNAMNLAVAQDLLRKTKLQIDVASSGEECLEMLKRKEYHLICMDHMMPGMDGVEALHAIRELEGNPSRDIPVIALTANAVVGAREFYLDAGFEDYLTKPIEPEKLEDMMIKYLPKELVYLSSDNNENAGEEDDDILDTESLIDMGINVSHGLKYMGGSRVLYTKILMNFHEVLVEKEEQLKKMLDKEDMQGYSIIVHALKGNARNIGADELAEEAFELEKKSKAGNREEVEVKSPILFSMMTTLRKNLDKYIKQHGIEHESEKKVEDKPKNTNLSDTEWNEKLKTLNEYLDDFDTDNIASCLKEIKSYKLTEKQSKMLRMCEKAVNDFAYDVAMEILATELQS